eukprot:s616_g24.t1
MSLTDSEPNFKSRCSALGITDAVVTLLVNSGINTIAKYAFSSSYVPGMPDETPFTASIQTALGRAPTVGELASLRRLFHECYALTASELKAHAERVEDAPVRKLAQPERADRLEKQQARLTGIKIAGKLEPSDRLVDRCQNMDDENRLHHVELTKCTSKEQEILNVAQREDRHITVDGSGSVKIKDKEMKLEADLSNDMLLRLCMMRRGLALDQCNILGYSLHDSWIEKVLDCRLESPPDGYNRITLQQIVNADRKLFLKLAELTRSGIQLTSTGRPVDAVFDKAMNHPDVLHLLQPLPTAKSSSSQPSQPSSGAPAAPRPGPYNRPSKGKGKGKQQQQGSLTIKMPQGLEGGGPTQPRPLRSEEFPHGLPDLTGDEQARVHAANVIYQNLAAFLTLCSHKNIPWAVENPARSYLWVTEWMLELQQFATLYYFTACAWGSTRPTKKAFLSTMPEMAQLEADCPGDHQHEPYGRKRDEQGKLIYATAEEAAYPRELCVQIRKIVQEALNLFPEHSHAVPGAVSHNAAGSVALATQPRGRRMPPLISEFVAFQMITTADPPPLDAKSCLTKPWHHLPIHAKLLSLERLSGEGGADSKPSKYRYKFGIFRSPKQWIDDAIQLQHPFDLYHAVPDELLKVVFDVLTLGPVEIAIRRTNTLKQWINMSKRLEAEECRLKASMEPGVESILRPKKLLLWEALAKQIGWPDQTLFREIAEGFKIVGLQEPSGVFDLEPRPPAFSPESLDDAAKFLRPAILGKTKSTSVDDDSQKLWDITCEEATNLHWMRGPIPEGDVAKEYNKPWLPVRRFGVWQSSGDKMKLRPIDDYAENKVNGAFGYADKLDLRTLDQIVWIGAAIARALLQGRVIFHLKDGVVLDAPVHESFLGSSNGQPLLSVLDLSNAYKQFATHPDCRRYSVITLKNPADQTVQCFEGRVLPFGATASVVHFNRCSRLLQHLGYQLYLPWSSYFDDFPVVSPSLLSKSTMITMTTMLDLLGFDYAKHKLQPFDTKASVLGVSVDFGRAAHDKILIGNKEGRLDEVRLSISKVLESGTITSRECSRLLGRLQYVDSFVMGRDGKLAMTELRNNIRCDSKLVQISPEARESLKLMLNRLSNGRPRELPCSHEKQPVLVFTDGASEGDVNTIGGLLYADGSFRYFSFHVPRRLVDSWRTSSKHVIAMVELYSVIVARFLWGKYLRGRKSIAFVDNESAKEALVKGSSFNAHFRALLLQLEIAEKDVRSWLWFARVPSHSNPSDGPSRGDCALMEAIGAIRDGGSCPVLGCALEDI